MLHVRSGSTSGPIVLSTGWIPVIDTSLTPAFTSIPSSMREVDTITVSANNLGPAGTYYWTIAHGTTSAADFNAESGSFTTSTLNGTGSFNIIGVIDTNVEGTRTFQVQVRTGSTSGTVILTSGSINLLDSSIQLSPDVGTVAEGGVVNMTVTAGAGTPAGNYNITLEPVSILFNSSDISSPTFPFSVSLSPSGSTSFQIFIAAGGGAESAEQFRIRAESGVNWYGRSLPITISANAS